MKIDLQQILLYWLFYCQGTIDHIWAHSFSIYLIITYQGYNICFFKNLIDPDMKLTFVNDNQYWCQYALQ